jgi:hypothetical protein
MPKASGKLSNKNTKREILMQCEQRLRLACTAFRRAVQNDRRRGGKEWWASAQSTSRPSKSKPSLVLTIQRRFSLLPWGTQAGELYLESRIQVLGVSGDYTGLTHRSVCWFEGDFATAIGFLSATTLDEKDRTARCGSWWFKDELFRQSAASIAIIRISMPPSGLPKRLGERENTLLRLTQPSL